MKRKNTDNVMKMIKLKKKKNENENNILGI